MRCSTAASIASSAAAHGRSGWRLTNAANNVLKRWGHTPAMAA
jgi:hypothetical protein